MQFMAGRKWDDDSFFREAARQLAWTHVMALHDLYEFFHQPGWHVRFGQGPKLGTFHALRHEQRPRPVLIAFTDGGICVNFNRFADGAGRLEPEMVCLAQELRSAGFDLPGDLYRRSPGFKPEFWAPRRPVLERAFRNAYDPATRR